VILGDVFDSRCDSSDSAGVYRLLLQAQKDLNAVVLRSNHQDKLERFLKGNSVRVSPELQRTLDDLDEAGVDQSQLLNWLESLPYGFCFKYGDVERRCAHAYFPSWVEVPDYDLFHFVWDPPRKAKQLMMYGPVSREEGNPHVGNRVEWWLREPQREWVRCAGHYHVIHNSNNNLVLDGGCGGTDRSWSCAEPPILALYNSVTREIVEFTAL